MSPLLKVISAFLPSSVRFTFSASATCSSRGKICSSFKIQIFQIQ